MSTSTVSIQQIEPTVNQLDEAEIQDCMARNGVSRAWAIIMLEPAPQLSDEDYRADYERMRRESPAGFSGEWALDASGNYTRDEVDYMRHPD